MAKPYRSIILHSVAPINAAVCNKSKSDLSSGQTTVRTRTLTNLESGEIYYEYTLAGEQKGAGVFVSYLIVKSS